jgi:phytoene dehydrogenase-like protein
LNKKYFDENIERIFDKGTTYSAVQVSLGVNCDLKQYPHRILISPTKKEKIFDETIDYILFSIYNFNEIFAPKGKTLIISLINSTQWNLWEKLKNDEKAYNSEKQRNSEYIIKEIEHKIPEIKGKVEMVDVATPLTFKRYTNAYQGSYMGWYTLPNKNSFVALPSVFPNLENFQLIGQWTQATGGLPMGTISGRWAIQRICKKEKVKF